MKKINIGIIGLGIVGSKHLQNLKQNKRVNKILVHDKNPKVLRDIKKKYKSVISCQKENLIFKDNTIDAVCICSYDNFHFNHVKKAIIEKKNIFIEKPLCLSERQLKIIKNLLDKSKIKIISNFVLRENSFFKEVKKKLENGFFGKIYLIDASYNYGRLEKITNGWRGAIKNYSVTLGGGIHLIDVVKFIYNKKFTKLTSCGNNISTKKNNFNFYDCITSIIQLEDNSIFNLTSNFGSVSPHNHSFKIYGTKGTAIYELKNSLFISNNNKNRILKVRYIKNNKGKILNEFINDLHSRNRSIIKKFRLEKEKLLEVTSICLKIDRALKKKNWVNL